MTFLVLVYVWLMLWFMMKELWTIVGLAQFPTGIYVIISMVSLISGALSVPLKEMRKTNRKRYILLVSILVIIAIALVYTPTFIFNTKIYHVANTTTAHMFNVMSCSFILLAITIGQSIARSVIKQEK